MESVDMNTMHPVLYLYVDSKNMDLFHKYITQTEKHNDDVLNGSHPNSGFDLFFPESATFDNINTKMVDFRVKCEMKYYNTLENVSKPSGFYLYPRSSLSKTPLMLSNHVGIIDSGYRGFLIGAFRNLSSIPYFVEKDNRLVQICSPDLKPFLVTIVDNEFFSITERGTGGFGSTG
jgi:dUTP pyrophosphatase